LKPRRGLVTPLTILEREKGRDAAARLMSRSRWIGRKKTEKPRKKTPVPMALTTKVEATIHQP
jgi:hypothetical protein